MDFEYWWLIAIPLFFALGWIAARIDIKQLLAESTSLPAAYFKGLNFLITDQHDKAIEAFIEAAKANAESLELHFALGSLFRRSGEVDRAINLHLSLLDRKELPIEQRKAIKAETSIDTELSTTGGTSDGRFIAKICKEVVEFGPINATSHKIDECVIVDDVVPLKNIYRKTLEQLIA